MKITRDDIKEMVNETLSIIIEGRRPYDNLTDLFKQNHSNIENGMFTFQNVDQTKYRTNEKNFGIIPFYIVINYIFRGVLSPLYSFSMSYISITKTPYKFLYLGQSSP